MNPVMELADYLRVTAHNKGGARKAILQKLCRPSSIHSIAMSSYNWSCLACGVCNQSSSIVCRACGCSPTATYAEIARRREHYVATGGVVLHNAAMQEGRPLPKAVSKNKALEWAAGVVVLIPSVVIFGWLPGWMRVVFDIRIVAMGLLIVIAVVVAIVGSIFQMLRKLWTKLSQPAKGLDEKSRITNI